MMNTISGWAYYTPLWRFGGGEAWTPTVRKKLQAWTFAIFSSSQPLTTGRGCPSPFEPLMNGLRKETEHLFCGNDLGMPVTLLLFGKVEKRGLMASVPAGGANHPFFLMRGGSWRRGGGIKHATTIPPPNHEGLEGCAAWGGRITSCFHGAFLFEGNFLINKRGFILMYRLNTHIIEK